MVCILVTLLLPAVVWRVRADAFAVDLPAGVKAVWDLKEARHEATPARERICLNGLWRWQPARSQDTQVPAASWGFFKAPGSWPGIGDYMQKDSQTVFLHPDWKETRLANVTSAWYEREVQIPESWKGRRVALRLDYLNSFAAVYLDGAKIGEIHFPGGDLDLPAAASSGAPHRLSLLVAALPLQGVMLSYTDSAAAREVKGTVARRGLCGDVYLVSTPAGPRITGVRVEPSVRNKECSFHATLAYLDSPKRYTLRARIVKNGLTIKELASPSFASGDLVQGRMAFAGKWMPDQLWDIHTPGAVYDAEVSLLDASGTAVDAAWTERFGFREFWIDGRDFYLNGTRIFLSAVPLDNAQISAALASYSAARESLERLKAIGINYVYTHNYGCEPGSHLGFEEILRAADDTGMLLGFSQPHFSHYNWQSPGADETNGYARHAEYYAGAAGNHPSVVMYSMSHNATGYNEDMNPDMIDGLQASRDNWSSRNVLLAQRAEAIVRRLDPGRIVYHHASGNLGSMHAINFYPNFVPIQELSDWFGHWAAQGVKPVFTCEYGAPFTWDWTLYRGWYKGQREFGSAKVPWEFSLAEWNASFLGDRAFQISEPEKANLRWEARQFRAGSLWHRWDYPTDVGSTRLDERYPIFAMYLDDNWRAFRTWGVSAISPWEHGHFWKLRDGLQKRREEFQTDWDHLQRPGFSADYIDQRYERMDLAFARSDWVPTAAAQALLRNNQPLLAYIGGSPASFTSKDHNFLPGQTVEKQLIIINNSRQPVKCAARWSFSLPEVRTGSRQISIETGQQERIPLRFDLPLGLPPGPLKLHASVDFGPGGTQEVDFIIDILPTPGAVTPSLRMALFDPVGETAASLQQLGVPVEPIQANTDLSRYDVLLVGKAALTVTGEAPDITRVRDGLRVVLFEQKPEVLEKRFGFRIEEYGLRKVFPRVPGHPLLAGISDDHLRDWRGEATLLPPRLTYAMRPRQGVTVPWCGLPVTRLWRCGNRGNVASVLIEKPACGDFLPIVDGGFGLQYSPLLEYREGRGMVLFCQMDVTGRTEQDPAAGRLLRNLLEHASAWKPPIRREAVFIGNAAARKHLEATGAALASYRGEAPATNQVLIIAAGGERPLERGASSAAWIAAGGRLLAVGLGQKEADAALPFKVTLKQGEHISGFFSAVPESSPFAGLSPAEIHNRDPRDLPLLTGGAAIIADGVLAAGENGNAVLCQLAPWEFDAAKQPNLKRTFRRTSFLVSRLLANLGLSTATPLLVRFRHPVGPAASEKRWLSGFYLDEPEEWDDPYRFFRW